MRIYIAGDTGTEERERVVFSKSKKRLLSYYFIRTNTFYAKVGFDLIKGMILNESNLIRAEK